MPDPLDIKTVGGDVMSDEQAKVFALSISAAVKAYIVGRRCPFGDKTNPTRCSEDCALWTMCGGGKEQ